MKLHEIESGVWIVPDLVYSVTANVQDIYFSVRIASILVEKPLYVRYFRGRTESLNNEHMRGNMVRYRVLDDLYALATTAAAEVATWIDERRSGPLEIVRS